MYRNGHIGLGLLFAAPIALIAGIAQSSGHTIAVFSIGVLTAQIPDVDQRIPVISHRGITHTVWFGVLASGTLTVALLALLSVPFTGNFITDPGTLVIEFPVTAGIIALGALSGFLSHLFGDILTEAYDYTVNPFWPVLPQSYTLGITTADSRFWNTAFLAGGVALTIVVVGVVVQVS
jgi:inner membrane protein